MAEAHTINNSNQDEDNKPRAPATQVSDAALVRLIAIDEDFTQEHATDAASEIKNLWRDLRKTDFAAYEIYNLAKVLRQGRVVLEFRLLRAFLVAWKVLDVNFPSLDSAGQAELIRDMVLCQLGPVKKQVTLVVDDETMSPARKQTDTALNTEETTSTRSAKAHPSSPASPFKLLFKTQKKWARQRQLKALISQAKKPDKRKRSREDEDENEHEVDGGPSTEEEVQMEPTPVSTPEKQALVRQKLERKRKLEALGSKKRRRFY